MADSRARGILGALLLAVLMVGCGGGSSGPHGPSIVSQSPPAGTVESPYAGYTFAAGGGLPPYVWSWSGAPPAGLTLSSGGVISGTPTRGGTYVLTVAVTDSSQPALTAVTDVTIVIQDTQPMVAAAAPNGVATYPYSFQFTVPSGGSPPFTFAVTSGALPPGLALGAGGTLSGTPTAIGTFAFTVTATDSGNPPQSGSAAAQVTVTAPAALVVNSTPSPPGATTGTPYSFQISESGGWLPLNWSVSSGALPAGLALDNTGAITGTPSLAGSYNFTVSVTDSAAPAPSTVSVPFTLLVTNPPPPTISAIPPPTATVGASYSFTFTAGNGLAPLTWSATGIPAGLSLSMAGMLSGTPTTAGIFPIVVTVQDALGRAVQADFTVRISLARPAMAFTATTGSLMTARYGHSASRLAGGKVLIAGGTTAASAALASAELYDPSTQMFTVTGSMTEARASPSAALLADAAPPNTGKVLVLGANDATADLFDPATAMFTATGAMAEARLAPTVTSLLTGKVLVTGGSATTTTAELYDPASGTFAATGAMAVARSGHTATRLADGRVLITGGSAGTSNYNSAELYDPVAGTFTATGAMGVARSGHQATLLPDGTVLITGPDHTAELYSPVSGSFAPVGNSTGYGNGRTASPLTDGTVATSGGDHIGSYPTQRWLIDRFCVRSFVYLTTSSAQSERFAPESEGFTALATLNTARDAHTATVLADGSVLVVGGRHRTVTYTLYQGCQVAKVTAIALSSAEILK